MTLKQPTPEHAAMRPTFRYPYDFRGVLLVILACISWCGTTRPAAAQPAAVGEWSGVINWPIEAIHTAMLPTGKVLIWQSWMQSVGLWDPATQQWTPLKGDLDEY